MDEGPTWDMPVTALGIYGGELFVGGLFEIGAGGKYSPYLAKVTLPTTGPSVPTGLIATKGTSNVQIGVSWNSSANADRYTVFRSPTSSYADALNIQTTYTTTIVDSDVELIPGKNYYYFVKSVDIYGGVSDPSVSDYGYKTIGTPSGVNASNGSSTAQVTVSWNGVSGASSYTVYRNGSNTTSGATSLGSTTSTNYTDAGATLGTHYWYFVIASGSNGVQGAYSAGDEGWRAVATIAAPTGVAASHGSSTAQVSISWAAVSGASGYAVHRNTSNTTASGLTHIGSPGGTSLSDSTATPGTTYWYFVTATNGSVTSVYSVGNDGYRAMSPPTGVTASDGTSSAAVNITWSAPSGAQSYTVYRNGSNTTSGATSLGSTTSTSYADTGAAAGTHYWYYVRAWGSNDVPGAYSAGDEGWRAVAYNPIWTNPAGGSWGSAGNWLFGQVASGSDVVADFSTLDLTADATVTLDGNRTIGHLVFGDTNPSHNWTLNGGTLGTLVLSSDNFSSIQVNNQMVSVENPLHVSSAYVGGYLVKSGEGTLSINATGSSLLPTTVSVADGTLDLSTYGWGEDRMVGSGHLTVNQNASLRISQPHAIGGDNNGLGEKVIIDGGRLILDSGQYISDLHLDGAWVSGSDELRVPANGSSYTVGATIIRPGWEHSVTDFSATINHAFGDANWQVDGNAELWLAGDIVGAYGLIKDGTGTMVIAGSCSYTGTTYVNGGEFAVASMGDIHNSSVIVNSSGILTGSGSISGPLTIANGGMLSSGDEGSDEFPPMPFYGLTVSNSLTLESGSIATFRLYRPDFMAWTQPVAGMTSTFYGGTLVVTLEEGELEAGDRFVLFENSSGGYGGGFSAVDLPPLASGLEWDISQLSVDGSIQVVSVVNFASWIASHFPGITNVASIGFNADPDRDGLNNAVEMVLGGNPATGMNTSLIPTLQIVNDPGGSVPAGTYHLFTYRCTDASEAAGIYASVQQNTDLSEVWIDAAVEIAGVRTIIDNDFYGVGTDRVRTYIPLGSHPKGFFRLKVIENPGEPIIPPSMP